MIGKKGLVRVPVTLFIVILLFLALLYTLSSSVVIKLITSFSSGLIIVVGGMYVYSYYNSVSTQLRGKLKSMNLLLISESSERINSVYEDVIQLYLQLSQRQQEQFSQQVESIRTILESQLRAKKKVEVLLEECEGLTHAQKKKKYGELFQYYKQLPSKVQQEYYPQIVHVREALEQGK